MRTRRFWSSILGVLVVLLSLTLSGGPMGWVTSVQAQPFARPVVAEDNTASLTVMGGAVTIRRKGTTDWQPVQGAIEIAVGDTIKTASDGRAILTFFEGSESLIDPDSEMTVEAMSLPANKPFDIKLRVVLGSTWHSVQKFFGVESRYEVDTPSATLVARGTMWWVNVDEDGRTQTKVLEGKVDMQGDYTIGIPGSWPADHPVRRFSSEITRVEPWPSATPTPAPSKNLTQNPGDDETTAVETRIGLGVLAQAFFIAQSMQTQLAPEQMAELALQLGCQGTCTMDDLVRAHREKIAGWGDIKKWVDDHRSLGDIRSGREEGPIQLTDHNGHSGDDDGGNGNDKNGGGNGNDKNGGGNGNDKGGGNDHGDDRGEGGHRK